MAAPVPVVIPSTPMWITSTRPAPFNFNRCNNNYQWRCMSVAAEEYSTSFQSTTPNCRPAVILPGLGNNSSDYEKLQHTLKQEHHVSTVVANVSRIDWLRNAAGLLDPNYWRGTLGPRPILDWYLERVDEAVGEAKLLAKGGNISLIGHSAGGWLARVYMEEFGLSNISLLLTLGTPHLYILVRFIRRH